MQDDPLVGTTLGQYEIVALIGRGGMASVYKAYQPALDRHVAIKVLPEYLAHDPAFSERFRREARAVASLEHPNILPVYDFGEQNHLSYIVMSLISGGALTDRMGAPVALDWALHVCGQVAQALDYAHTHGVVHRDVKPANILLGPEDRAFLADFGIAKLANASRALTRSGLGVGTPEYLSPEQAQGLPLDGRSDLYSLAMTLFELLAGTVPFRAESAIAVVLKQLNDPVPSLREYNAEVPPAVDMIVRKALAKRREERFDTATELIDALRRVSAPAHVMGLDRHADPARAGSSETRFSTEPPSTPRLLQATPFLTLPLRGGGDRGKTDRDGVGVQRGDDRAEAARTGQTVGTDTTVQPTVVVGVQPRSYAPLRRSLLVGIAAALVVALLIELRAPGTPPETAAAGDVVVATATANAALLATMASENLVVSEAAEAARVAAVTERTATAEAATTALAQLIQTELSAALEATAQAQSATMTAIAAAATPTLPPSTTPPPTPTRALPEPTAASIERVATITPSPAAVAATTALPAPMAPADDPTVTASPAVSDPRPTAPLPPRPPAAGTADAPRPPLTQRIFLEITNADCRGVTGVASVGAVAGREPLRDYAIKGLLVIPGGGQRSLWDEVAVVGPRFMLEWPVRGLQRGAYEVVLIATKPGLIQSQPTRFSFTCN